MNTILRKDFALLLLRVAFGFRLIYGTFDNIIDWDRMVEFKNFLATNGFPIPMVCAVVSVYLQFLAGVSWIIGYQVKWTSLLMIINFVIALVGVHLINGDSYLSMAPAIHLLVVAAFFYFVGPGRYAIQRPVRQ